jgi:hypothetical protein
LIVRNGFIIPTGCPNAKVISGFLTGPDEFRYCAWPGAVGPRPGVAPEVIAVSILIAEY